MDAQQLSITHLEAIRRDLRDEIKQRIRQRDQYVIQLTLAIGAILAISFTPVPISSASWATIGPISRKGVLLVPMISIYYTILILYSYRVHTQIAGYLHDKLELKMAELHGLDAGMEWEHYYKATNNKPGIRRRLFFGTLWTTSSLSMGYLWAHELTSEWFIRVLIVASLLYLLLMLWVTTHFWHE